MTAELKTELLLRCYTCFCERRDWYELADDEKTPRLTCFAPAIIDGWILEPGKPALCPLCSGRPPARRPFQRRQRFYAAGFEYNDIADYEGCTYHAVYYAVNGGKADKELKPAHLAPPPKENAK